MALRDVVAALLGLSAYDPKQGYGPEHDDDEVEKIRKGLGGNLAMQPTTRLRWYLADLETAAAMADSGDISRAAQLYRAMRRDGVIAGLLGTLTSGIVRLPKRFYGDHESVECLRARNGSRSIFDDMFPPSELSLLACDGKALGVGLAELVPVPGRDFPVMIRLEPEFLRYRWIENRWYYLSVAGPLPITPGDGRWILHLPGGRIAPWITGLWPALGRSFINKEHALLHRSNYGGKLANAARVAVSPSGSTEEQKQAWWQAVMAWGVNTVFGITPGYDVKLLESNGQGYEVFQQDIDTSDKEIAIAIAGQVVTVDGGAGFQNADVFRSIRADIIKDVAEQLAYTINTQGLPQFIVSRWGLEALETGAIIEWDVARPKDMAVEAAALTAVATAIGALRQNLEPYGRELNVDEITARFGVPILGDRDGDGAPDAEREDDESLEPAAVAAHRAARVRHYAEGARVMQ